MPELEDITYSRAETVRAVRGYYAFLTNMYLDESRVAEPPSSSGWPQITTRNFHRFGKTDEVVSLLRHLPYITGEPGDPWTDRPHAAAGINFHDYSWEFQSHKNAPLNEEEARYLKTVTENGLGGQVPPHVVGIISGSAEQGAFLIDTELGIIHWTDCPTEIQYKIRLSTKGILSSPGNDDVSQLDIHDRADDGSTTTAPGNDEEGLTRRIAHVHIHNSRDSQDSELQNLGGSADDSSEPLSERDPDIIEQVLDDPYHEDWGCPENEQDWRGDSGKWAIADFFEVLKLQFRALNWVPLSDRVVLDVWSSSTPERSKMLAEVQEIWREHGWPAAEAQGTFNKVECLAHIRMFLCDKYPMVGKLLGVCQ